MARYTIIEELENFEKIMAFLFNYVFKIYSFSLANNTKQCHLVKWNNLKDMASKSSIEEVPQWKKLLLSLNKSSSFFNVFLTNNNSLIA